MTKCSECELPTYAKLLCRRHYKRALALKNNTYKKDYARRKLSPNYIIQKRLADKAYRTKKKLGIDTARKINDRSLINQDWQKYAKLWRDKTYFQTHHAEKIKSKYREYKILALQHYSDGTMKCLMCGIDDIRVLDLDHINDDGAKHREEINYNLIFWIKKNNFPPMFQVLCRNCNWIKELDRRQIAFEKKYINKYKPLKKPTP